MEANGIQSWMVIMRSEAEMCFFTSCTNPVNARGKFCEEHDKKEKKAAQEMTAIFDKVEVNHEND